ncbi:hypothetical protein LEP1GSC125_0580 [Leptospira mayottensis 200901122]|uniref:Uncharacterized protein n=1 Tax=Leptospira mayottensis 200901122 TaxID=1193010 RepID=A0AA87MT67_9LEPT|nr:hypothetical protein LEP1GSC125_0580 [Leptospira mayottensis 200901122]
MVHFFSSNRHFHRKRSIYIKKQEYKKLALKFFENKSNFDNILCRI